MVVPVCRGFGFGEFFIKMKIKQNIYLVAS